MMEFYFTLRWFFFHLERFAWGVGNDSGPSFLPWAGGFFFLVTTLRNGRTTCLCSRLGSFVFCWLILASWNKKLFHKHLNFGLLLLRNKALVMLALASSWRFCSWRCLTNNFKSSRLLGCNLQARVRKPIPTIALLVWIRLTPKNLNALTFFGSFLRQDLKWIIACFKFPLPPAAIALPNRRW